MPALGAGIHVLSAAQQGRRVADKEDGKAAGAMKLLAFTDILTAYDNLARAASVAAALRRCKADITEAQEPIADDTAHDGEIEKRRKALGWHVKERMIEFAQGITAEHRRLRMSIPTYLATAPIESVATSPVIYSLIVPLLIVDAWVSLYQAICFRAYRIPRVRRSQYIVFDRQHLAYLNWIEALNCVFCAYANGLVAYVREISSRTEQYWCPIKHALQVYDPHKRYYEFLEYGDADGYRARLEEFRERLRTGSDATKDENVSSR
ncbi:MAG: hypothetical protein ACLPID_00145 [Beijerinckiaceae bacterium]